MRLCLMYIFIGLFLVSCRSIDGRLTPESLVSRRTTAYCDYHRRLKDVAVRQDSERSELYEGYFKLLERMFKREELIGRYLISRKSERIVTLGGDVPCVAYSVGDVADVDNNEDVIKQYKDACLRDKQLDSKIDRESIRVSIMKWKVAKKTEEGERARNIFNKEVNVLVKDMDRYLGRKLSE